MLLNGKRAYLALAVPSGVDEVAEQPGSRPGGEADHRPVNEAMLRDRPQVDMPRRLNIQRRIPLKRSRSKFACLAVATPLVLVVADPAGAHVTSLEGTMVVTGNAGGSSTAVAYGSGNPAACNTTSGGAQATSSGGSVGITVSPAPTNGSCPSVKLKAGTYKVFYLNNASTLNNPAFECVHNWAFLPTPSLGSMQISSTGNGAGTYALPNGLAVTPTDGATVCITDLTKDRGFSSQVHGQAASVTIVP